MATPQTLRPRVITFLGLTVALSSVFWWLVITAGTVSAQGGAYVPGLMWSPGVAAILTQLVHTRSLRGLGWGWGRTR